MERKRHMSGLWMKYRKFSTRLEMRISTDRHLVAPVQLQLLVKLENMAVRLRLLCFPASYQCGPSEKVVLTLYMCKF